MSRKSTLCFLSIKAWGGLQHKKWWMMSDTDLCSWFFHCMERTNKHVKWGRIMAQFALSVWIQCYNIHAMNIYLLYEKRLPDCLAYYARLVVSLLLELVPFVWIQSHKIHAINIHLIWDRRDCLPYYYSFVIPLFVRICTLYVNTMPQSPHHKLSFVRDKMCCDSSLRGACWLTGKDKQLKAMKCAAHDLEVIGQTIVRSNLWCIVLLSWI